MMEMELFGTHERIFLVFFVKLLYLAIQIDKFWEMLNINQESKSDEPIWWLAFVNKG